MNNFIIENNFLVLSKSIKQTKAGSDGTRKEYGSISLYCTDTDEFQKIFIFENYKDILAKYDTNKSYKIKLQVSNYEKDGKMKTSIKFM